MRFLEQGARGVQLFYVTSAVTLLMSWKARADGYRPFLIRRLFRIVPLFWIAALVYLSFASTFPAISAGYFSPGTSWSWVDVSRQLLFLDAIFPSNSSIVPGGWTIDTEMFFYLLLPALIFFIRNWLVALAAYFISIILTYKAFPIYFDFLVSVIPNIPKETIAVWATLSLPAQLPIFLAGFVAFYLLEDQNILPQPNKKSLVYLLLLSSLLMGILSIIPSQLSLWGIPLGILVVCFGRRNGGLLINKPIINLGKVSFSAYIWHFMIINLIYLERDLGVDLIGLKNGGGYTKFVILLLLILLITYPISYISFKYIEKPMIKIGGVIAKRY